MYKDTKTGKVLDDYDVEAMFDDMLNEVYGPVEIGNLTYDPSRVLKEVDPTAYRVGMWEYINNMVSDGDWEEYEDNESSGNGEDE